MTRRHLHVVVRALYVDREELVHKRQLFHEVRQVLHLERPFIEQLAQVAAVVDESKLARPARLGLHDERHDHTRAYSFRVPCLYMAFPRRDRAHVAELDDGLSRPLCVLRLDTVVARVVRRGPHAVRQGHFQALAPYAMQKVARGGRRPHRFRLGRAQSRCEALRYLSGSVRVHDAAIVVTAVWLDLVQPAVSP
jgi:hypothetical protein